ncbi:MAG TPA: hypothetical protein VMJ10_33360 [Kofleriaceae bacterium]|nr:hypothetical protein [Kofleriaceae bacterium]
MATTSDAILSAYERIWKRALATDVTVYYRDCVSEQNGWFHPGEDELGGCDPKLQINRPRLP